MLRQLCKKYQESDSVSERLKFESDITKIVVNFVADISAIRENYGAYSQYDFDPENDKEDEYRISNIWDYAVEVISKDRESCDSYLITFEEFENFTLEYDKYRKSLINSRIRELELNKSGYERQSKEVDNKLKKLNTEIEKLNKKR